MGVMAWLGTTRDVAMESEQTDRDCHKPLDSFQVYQSPSGGTEMTKSAILKIGLMCIVAIVLACAPKPVSARRSGGGSHGSGGSHGGSSHGGGGFHGGGHSSSRGSGHSYGSSRGRGPVSSARIGGGRANSGRMSGGSYASAGGFSSRPTGNFARNSNFGGGSFGSSAASRNFGRSGTSQPVARSFRSTTGQWNSFGNSAGRTMPASARAWGNSTT
jgi:hypothetical protein